MDTIERLRSSSGLNGHFLAPGETGFNDASTVWNARSTAQPSAIVRCHSAAEVQAAIKAAARDGLLLSVKGGGHAYAANTIGESGLLIDLSLMKDIAIMPEQRLARVGPGVKWGEFDAAAQKYGLASTGVTVSTVGVAGSTLGGGTGYLLRKHGMAIDNLLSAEVVTADGQRLRASAEENSDLFWAIRGGGGNFGVATSFEFRLHQVGPQVLAGQIMHFFEDAGELLRAYRDFMSDAPEEIQCYAFILRVPPIEAFPEELHGRLALDFVVFHLDPEGMADLQPLLKLGEPFFSAVGPQPYTAVQQSFDAGLPAGQRYTSRAHYLAELSDKTIDTITEHAPGLVGPFSVAYLEPGGGAAARVDAAATAFAHRDASFSFHILAGWIDSDNDERVQSWAYSFHQAMAPHATGGVYVNLLGKNEPNRVKAAYGRNYSRLSELKKKWDPSNLFRSNHNILPAG